LPMKRLIGGQFTGLPHAHPKWVRGRCAQGTQVRGFRETEAALRIEKL
jgi:hypothetical protein